MSVRTIHAEVVETKIVTCTKCGQDNRLYKQAKQGTYRCGSCRVTLRNPFATPAKSKSKGLAVLRWLAFGVVVVGCIQGIKVLPWEIKASVSPPQSNGTAKALHPPPLEYLPANFLATHSRPLQLVPLRPRFTEPEEPLPSHGTITWYSDEDPVAPLTIKSAIGSNYLVKLSDYTTQRDVLSVFVHGGSTAILDVPLGTYCIKYASGQQWYGPVHLFGPDTAYSKADSAFNFHRSGNRISGYTLTLYKVEGGNLTTRRITPTEF